MIFNKSSSSLSEAYHCCGPFIFFLGCGMSLAVINKTLTGSRIANLNDAVTILSDNFNSLQTYSQKPDGEIFASDNDNNNFYIYEFVVDLFLKYSQTNVSGTYYVFFSSRDKIAKRKALPKKQITSAVHSNQIFA